MGSFNPVFIKTVLSTFAVAIVFFCMCTGVSAATFVVNTTNDTADAAPGNGVCADALGACSLRAAISEANSFAGADTITVPAGTYTQTLVAADEDANAGGDWDIASDVTINGAGAATTIIQAAAAAGTALERVLHVTNASTVALNGITIRNGNKAATLGASATSRGGGIRSLGNLTIQDSVISGNNAPGGGGIRNELNITLIGTTVSGNNCINSAATSCFGGGMYSNSPGTVTITNSTFSGNVANSTATNGSGFGGGMGIEGAGFTLNITGSTFSGNNATGNGSGGGIGGALRYLAASATPVVTITASSFSSNSVTGAGATGGAVQGGSIGGTVTFTATTTTFSGNSSTNNEGVFAHLTTTASPSTVNFNRSTISGNSAVNFAGVRNNPSSTGIATMNFTNSTLSGNIATASGGALTSAEATAGTSVVNLNFTTVDNNSAAAGGGINNGGGTVNLKNSIVADNTAPTGPDINGAVVSQDYNHIENTAGATITGVTTNNATGDPALMPLGNYGGPTQTHFPNAGSSVVNTIPSGVNDCGTVVTIDQRGVTRPQGAACDKGSVEVGVVTSAGVSVGGRVVSGEGRGIRGATVRLSDGSRVIQTVMTGRNGGFQFDGVEAGRSYLVSVESRRFEFSPQSVEVNDNVSGLVLSPGGGSRSEH